MLCLLRHVMDVVEPRTGWDNKPPEYDTGVGADLTRIRHFRNMIAHSESREIDDTDFSSVWKELSNVSLCLLYFLEVHFVIRIGYANDVQWFPLLNVHACYLIILFYFIYENY